MLLPCCALALLLAPSVVSDLLNNAGPFTEAMSIMDADGGGSSSSFLSTGHRAERWNIEQKPNQDYSKQSLTQKDRKEFILAHNHARSIVSPMASDMLFMTWNDTIEAMAQRYARTCHFKHGLVEDPWPFPMGQNLWAAKGIGYYTTRAVWAWDKEKHVYIHNGYHECEGVMCSHYTAVVWSASQQVGCGISYCDTIPEVGYSNAWIVVCNYSPAGNVRLRHGVASYPYDKARSCSNCPDTAPTCENKLCRKSPVCAGLTCHNGGTMEDDTCLCNCPPANITGEPGITQGPFCKNITSNFEFVSGSMYTGAAPIVMASLMALIHATL